LTSKLFQKVTADVRFLRHGVQQSRSVNFVSSICHAVQPTDGACI